MATYTVFGYLYRDASNYKVWGSLLLEGAASESDTARLYAVLHDYDFFIAEQVGIPALYEYLWQYSDGPNEDDHVWHAFDQFREPMADELSLEVWGTVSELVDCFAAITKWDEALSPHWAVFCSVQ